MDLELQSQVKGIIGVVITLFIAVSVTFVQTFSFLWIIIIGLGVIQVLLVLIPSIEEKFYRRKMKHMEDMETLDKNYEIKVKEIKLSKKLQDFENKAHGFETKKIKGTKLLISKKGWLSYNKCRQFKEIK